MKKIANKIVALVVLAVFLGSCDNDTLDQIDTNPNNPTNVAVELLIPNAQMSLVNLCIGSKQAQWASTFVEHTTNVRINVMNPGDNAGIFWKDNYLNLANIRVIIEKAEAEGKWTHVGLAKIMYAIIVANLTDLYGDIPLSEALQGSKNRAPRFDTQDSVYTQIQNTLDEAIDALNKSSISSPGKYDLLRKGNVALWKKTAYALKARYYNRLSNIAPQKSAEDALTAIGNAFTHSNDDLTFKGFMTGNVNINPFTGTEKREQAFAASETILDIINSFNSAGYEDPRANRWFLKIAGEFVGAPSGENIADQKHKVYSGISMTNVLAENAPMPIITFAEIKFIEAEAKLRLGRKVEANSAYETAVVEACKAAGISSTDIAAYTTQGRVFPGANNLTLEDIIKQKYLSFFMFQSIEAFNDYRRTGIPAMQNPYGVIKRFPYPGDELDRNPNSPKNINDQTMYTEKVWWAKN